MYNDVIGILGGMGSFATLHFFEAILKAFPAEKEWDRPRIIIDNRCTMPSRVLAVLEGIKREQLVNEMCDSVKSLLNAGATKIILACNTSHCFLPDIIARIPKSEIHIVNIIENCCRKVAERGIKQIGLIASEGTIKSQVFASQLQKYGIKISIPKDEQYMVQRELIEAVKQDHITDETIKKFIYLLKSMNEKSIILGCTEFPILFSKCKNEDFADINIFDPLICVIDKLKVECR